MSWRIPSIPSKMEQKTVRTNPPTDKVLWIEISPKICAVDFVGYTWYTPPEFNMGFFSSRTIILQNTVWFKTYGVHQHRLSSNQNMPHKMTTILNCVEHVWTTKSLGLWPIRFFSGDLLASWWRLSSRAGMPKGDECWMLECWMSISPFFLGGWRIWRFMGFNLREGYMHEKMENS